MGDDVGVVVVLAVTEGRRSGREGVGSRLGPLGFVVVVGCHGREEMRASRLRPEATLDVFFSVLFLPCIPDAPCAAPDEYADA